MALLTTSGKITLLRVNEVGDRFGPPADAIEAEVIVQLDTHPAGAVSGFKLRADANQPVREGMLDLLRDAFTQGWRVHFDHEVPAGKKKGTITRLWVTKDSAAATGTGSAPGGGVVFGTVGTFAPVAPSGGASPLSGTTPRRSRRG